MPGVIIASYAPNPRGGMGWVLYNVQGQFLAQPFDLGKLDFAGPPAVVANGVGNGRWWYASANGLLAFRHNYGTQYQLTWFSRDGRALGTVGETGLLATPRISPDQKMIAFQRTSEQNTDIWTFDLTRNSPARFTFERGFDGRPIWSSDGSSIIYSSAPETSSSGTHMVERPANGVGNEKNIASQSGNTLIPTAVSRDGRWLVFTEQTATSSTTAIQPRNDSSTVIRVRDRQTEEDGSISPDGRWLLYSSIPSIRREVLVQSMPKEAGGSASAVGKWQISANGGSQPTWRGDGKEIFFVAPDGVMMAVPVESGADFFRVGVPKPLFQTRLELDPNLREYDVTPDGQRFLLNQHVPDSTDAPIIVVVNWPKLLEKQK